MTKGRVFAALACASTLACQPQRPEVGDPAPAPGPARTVATFTGTVDPVSGAIRVDGVTPAGRTAALSEVPVVQDGQPGTGPAETVELVTESVGEVAGGCGALASYEGAVRLRSFYGARTLSNVHAEILRVSLTGRESCRSAQPVLGVSSRNGLFAYPSVTAAGTARDSAVATWSFRLPDQEPFSFVGRIVADVLSPCTGQTVLGTPVSSAGGRKMVSADFDGDGTPDVAILNGTTTLRTSIYHGDGKGRFTWTQDLGGGGDIAVADVTGDGTPDLVVSNGTSVNVYSNAGTSFGSTPTVITPGGTATGVALGELTGDSRPDLAVFEYSTGTVTTFANTGAVGTVAFTLAGTRQLNLDRAQDAAIGDVNGDGRGDVVVAVVGLMNSNAVAVFLGAGGGAILSPTSYAMAQVPYAVQLADVDRDGRPDVLVTGSVQLLTLRNLGGGAYPAPISLAPPVAAELGGNPFDVVLRDLNGDGWTDAAASISSGHRLAILLNDGTGLFGAAVNYPAGSSTSANAAGIVVGDWNGDARLDAAIVDSQVSQLYAYLGLGDGTFRAYSTLAVGSSPTRVLAGDLDGDGDADLVALNYASGTATIYTNTAAGFTGAGLNLGTGSYPWDGALADLSGDGIPDLVVVHPSQGTISVRLGGGGTFGAPTSYTVGANPETLSVGDLNGDGLLDVAVVSATGKRVDVLLGTGGGSLVAATPLTLAAAGYGVAIGDLDGDGIGDLVVGLAGSGVVTYKGTGGGSFAAPATLTGRTAYRVLLADLTNDGLPELVAARAAAYPAGVSVSKNLGAGGFGPETLYAGVLSDTLGVAAADLDGDGNTDLVATDNGANKGTVLATLRNLGDGTFAAPLLWQTGLSPRGVAVADLDGDGRLDLAVANSGAGTLSIIRNECW